MEYQDKEEAIEARVADSGRRSRSRRRREEEEEECGQRHGLVNCSQTLVVNK